MASAGLVDVVCALNVPDAFFNTFFDLAGVVFFVATEGLFASAEFLNPLSFLAPLLSALFLLKIDRNPFEFFLSEEVTCWGLFPLDVGGGGAGSSGTLAEPLL